MQPLYHIISSEFLEIEVQFTKIAVREQIALTTFICESRLASHSLSNLCISDY